MKQIEKEKVVFSAPEVLLLISINTFIDFFFSKKFLEFCGKVNS